MLHKRKEVLFALVAVVSLTLCVIVLLATTNNIANVSAVEANGVGVYWDSNCTDGVFSINWGNLTPGSVKNVIVYIRNEEEKPMRLILSTSNWNPQKASEYLNLKWDYTEGRRMNPGETLRITLSLSVSRYIQGISSFTFYIIVTGNNNPLGDVNGDGTVDGADIGLVGIALWSKPGDPKWDSRADVNGDGIIDGADIGLVSMHLWESWL